MSAHWPGHWHYQEGADAYTHIVRGDNNLFICQLSQDRTGKSETNARLIAAAPELMEAARLLEVAEAAHTNCEECEGEGVPELCPECFPLFDNARVARRAAIAKAEFRVLKMVAE